MPPALHLGGGGSLQGRASCPGAIKARHRAEPSRAAGTGPASPMTRTWGSIPAGTRSGDGRGAGRNQVGRGREQEAPGRGTDTPLPLPGKPGAGQAGQGLSQSAKGARAFQRLQRAAPGCPPPLSVWVRGGVAQPTQPGPTGRRSGQANRKPQNPQGGGCSQGGGVSCSQPAGWGNAHPAGGGSSVWAGQPGRVSAMQSGSLLKARPHLRGSPTFYST